MKLTEKEIAEICEVLHRDVQFYDGFGIPSNTTTIEQIETALFNAFAE